MEQVVNVIHTSLDLHVLFAILIFLVPHAHNVYVTRLENYCAAKEEPELVHVLVKQAFLMPLAANVLLDTGDLVVLNVAVTLLELYHAILEKPELEIVLVKQTILDHCVQS